jgi:polyadenylate-binding protein 2
MKARLQEMEDEANKLKEMQTRVELEMNGGGGGGGGGGDSEAGQEAREEADARSVHVGGVDYATTPEELQQHFQGCGTVNRVTILTDRYENPKGFAYVEFLETDAVTNAIALTDSEIHGRKLKVNAKRTNVPGMKAGGGRGGGGRGGRGGGGRGFNPYMNPMMMMMNPFMMGGRGGGRGRGRGGGRGGRGRGDGAGRHAPY